MFGKFFSQRAVYKCPDCGGPFNESDTFCPNCGVNLEKPIEQAAEAGQQPAKKPVGRHAQASRSAYAPSTYSASSYTALRGIASLVSVLGWLIIGIAGLGALSGLFNLATAISSGSSTSSMMSGIVIAVASVIIGGLGFVILRVIAESISVLLDIEANTRRAANILEDRLNVSSKS